MGGEGRGGEDQEQEARETEGEVKAERERGSVRRVMQRLRSFCLEIFAFISPQHVEKVAVGASSALVLDASSDQNDSTH